MIYSVGRIPTVQDATLRERNGRERNGRERNSSETISQLPTEKYYAVAEITSRRPLANEEPSSLIAEAGVTETEAEQLAANILQRIESRLPCRIRKLKVFITENAVILEGQCSTYYTKQIAQHTAMGVLDYERLINHIEVCSTR